MEQAFVPTRFGKYELLERIAIGGMAEVFRARLTGEGGFEKHLVIKRILPHLSMDTEFVHMLIDEAKIAGCLYHPNIIQTYDLGKIEGTYFIAMEFIEGGDLKIILRRCAELSRSFPIADAVFCTTEILKGLQYAHTKTVPSQNEAVHLQIIHRDISPPNILVSYEGEVKILDFGIAKAATRMMQTSAGVLKGKFEYMSPEQASGIELDSRSDIFSIGLVLYEMLTGRNAFDGASDIEVLNHVRKAHIIAPRKLNREIPSRLEEITLRALKRDPDDRYQRAGDMRTDLMDYAFKASHVSNASKVAALMRGLFKEDIAAGRSASHKAALPDAEDHRAQAYARRSPDVSIDAALDDEVETLPADGPAALLPDTSFPPEDAVTAVVNMSTDSLAQASAHRATDHHEEIMVSTQSAVNLLQDFLDKSATNHVLPRSTPAQSKQTDAPVAVSFFHGPDPDIEARPVELKYGFNQEEVATTVQEIPSLEQAQNAGVQASQLHAQTPPEPHLISGEEDDIDLEPMSAEMSLPMPEGATYGGSPQTPQDGPLPPAFRPSAPSSAQENGRSDRGGPAIEHSESRVAQNAASQSSSHTAETESEEALVATREDLPPFPAATQPSGHLDASPYSSASGNLHQVHTKVYPQDSDREAKGDTTRAIERDRTLPVLSDEHLIGKSSARWGAAGRDPNTDAPHLAASFSSSRTLAYFIGFLAGLLPSLLVAVLMSRSIEPTIPAIGQALPTKGELIIRTERGVETLLDGNVVGGEYPLALELLPGREYSVRLTKPGTPDYVVPVRLEPGQSMVLMVPRLTPFPLGEEDRTSTSAP